MLYECNKHELKLTDRWKRGWPITPTERLYPKVKTALSHSKGHDRGKRFAANKNALRS